MHVYNKLVCSNYTFKVKTFCIKSIAYFITNFPFNKRLHNLFPLSQDAASVKIPIPWAVCRDYFSIFVLFLFFKFKKKVGKNMVKKKIKAQITL